jgi:hypothetical protein
MNINLLVADFLSNLGLWIPILLTIVSSVITGLTNYPKASGFVAELQKVLGVLSWVQHVDSPVSVAAVKLPLSPAKAP